MAVGEEAHEDQLEHLSLADDRALDLVEHGSRGPQGRREGRIVHDASMSSSNAAHSSRVIGELSLRFYRRAGGAERIPQLDVGAPPDSLLARRREHGHDGKGLHCQWVVDLGFRLGSPRQGVGREREAGAHQVHQQHGTQDREHPDLEADRRGPFLGNGSHQRDCHPRG